MTALDQLSADEMFGRITHAQADTARTHLLGVVLDLVRAAHAAQWTHDSYGPSDDREHVWRAPYPRTEKVTFWRGVCEMQTRPGATPRWSVRPETAVEVEQMLALVGLRAQMAGAA
ncbi:MAG: hypothetical protein V4515_12675 [Chloroflexota bacterium]